MGRFDVAIASPSDRIGLVAELWYDEEMWGELRYEGPDFLLEIYPPPSSETWLFDAEDAIATIERAKAQLKSFEIRDQAT